MERALSAGTDFLRLRERVRPILGDGTSYMLATQFLQTFMRFFSSLVLTRLLTPDAYGVVGIVASVIYILELTSDMGLRTYVIRHRDAGAELLKTVWTIRLIRNAILTIIMFVGADFFAQLYDAPQVAVAIRVCSLLFFSNSLASLSYFLTERHRGVIRLSTLEFVKFLISTGAAIIAAYFLRNYWAIVISMFVQSVYMIATSYFLMYSPPVGFRLERKHFADLWSYWRYIIPASIIMIVLTQTNTFLVANFFPIEELGKFSLATTLALTIDGIWGSYVLRVFDPRFAHEHRENPENELNVYYNARRQVTWLFAFGIGGLIGGGELVVKILYNDLYRGAGLYLSILCLRQLARLVTLPAEHSIIAKGFIRMALTMNILRLIWAVIAGVTAYFLFSPIAVIIAISLADIALIPFVLYQQKRFGLLRAREELAVPALALAGAAIGYGCYHGALALIAAGMLPDF